MVAGEVKELAQETARATDDITKRVAAIQGDTRQAIEAIARIAEVIVQINDHQSEIAATVEEQSAITAAMTTSINEAAAGAASIAGDITSVAEVARATTVETDKAKGAADVLTSTGARLAEVVGRFRYLARDKPSRPGSGQAASAPATRRP